MRKTRLLSLCVLLILLSGKVIVYGQEPNPAICFGIIADIQYCDCEDGIGRSYRNSLTKLEECVAAFNAEGVDFTVNLGDLIDRDTSSFGPVLKRLGKLHAPCHNTTGNHDYPPGTDKGSLYRKLGMPSPYYSFEKEGWVFVMLNTNEVSSYSNQENDSSGHELQDMQEILRADNRPNTASYNGGISVAQMQWLMKILRNAEDENNNVIIFTHHPLWPENRLSALNNREILRVIGGFKCVRAMFAGHHHPGDFGYYGDIPCITLEGMVETIDQNAFGIVRIYGEKIVLEGHGRATSREFTITR